MEKPYHQVVKVVASRDFKFYHIDAGIGTNGLQRIATETHEEEVLHCLIYPVLDKLVRSEFMDLEGVALTFRVEWV